MASVWHFSAGAAASATSREATSAACATLAEGRPWHVGWANTLLVEGTLVRNVLQRSPNWAVGICLAPLIGWFLYAFFKADAGVQSAILALIGVVTAGIIAHVSAKRREIEARHFSEKRAGYMALIDLMMDMFMAEKMGKKPLAQEDLLKKLYEFKKVLLIWADAEVIKTWDKMEAEMADADDPIAVLATWDVLLRALRRDLGKDDSQLGFGELVSLILVAKEKHKVKGLEPS